MIDMAQADRTLRQRPMSHLQQHRMCWTIALTKAANQMGFRHYMDVPSEQDDDLRAAARQIQGGND